MKRYEMDFRRSHLANAANNGKRRTPVPVLPPRIPTPMPAPAPTVNNNNMSKSSKSTSEIAAHETSASPRLVAKTPYKLLDNEVKTAWINPRIMSKVDLSLIRSNDYKCPSERNNMNMHTHYNHNLSHQKQHQHHPHHHQQQYNHHHQQLQVQHQQQSHAVGHGLKNSTPEWEPVHVVATTTMSSSGNGGRNKHRSSSASAALAGVSSAQQQPHTPAQSQTARGVERRNTRHSSTPPTPHPHPLHVGAAVVAVAAPDAIVNKHRSGMEGARGVKLSSQIPCPRNAMHESRRVARDNFRDNTKQSVPKVYYNERNVKITCPSVQHQHQQQQQQTQHLKQIHSQPMQLQMQQLQVPQLHHHQASASQCFLAGEESVFGVYQETKYTFAVNGMPGSIAQASAAAAFFARAAQKLNLSSSPHRRKRTTSEDGGGEASTVGFCGALQRSPPPVPPALLRRIGVKEITGVGKVKVMLRVSTPTGHQDVASMGANSFFNLDKRKKQVTLIDPTTCSGTSAPEDRRVGVAAPKMFAFDAMFSQDDSQTEVCSSALTDVIHAVINGTDGCLFCFGHAGLGKSYTMLGTPENANTLGIIPCAISWLFRGINEQKQKTGARFSVRVSAVEICGPTNQLRDLLAGHSNDSEQSPGVYLRDDPLFGNQPPHCELRVPTAEKAAHYLDAAVDCRSPRREDAPRDSHLLFTLHVYQYSVAGKGGVAGGRSRLHLIDLGNSERGKASGGIPLSGLGNILLAIFNGQKHLPYKEHKLTHLLKDCLSSLTCHAAMIAHVSPYAQNYNDTLTTVQLASRIHRMRRRRIKFVNAATGNGSGGSSGEEATRTQGTGTSSEPDPSSSDLSADTVIYVGPADDATDGEHPPVYIPSLNSGDNRCVMSKALRGSSAEQRPKTKEEKTPTHRPSIKAVSQNGSQSAKTSPAHTSNTPKASPARQLGKKQPAEAGKHQTNGASDEQWIDGPRISKSKVAEARHFMKEQQHVKKRETWIDGPMQAEPSQGYGYMDNHKKNMIRKWVEHQTFQIVQKGGKPEKNDKTSSSSRTKELTQFKTFDDKEEAVKPPLDSTKKFEIVEEGVIRTGLKLQKSAAGIPECKTPEELRDDEEDEEEPEIPPALPLIKPLSSREVSLESLDQLLKERQIYNAEYNNLQQQQSYEDQNGCQNDSEEEEDEDEVLEIIEVEEPLEPVPMQDCCLQVTEEDIAYCMGFSENPLPEVDQENPLDHPLRILSQENLTVVSTFTDSMSVYTDLERILPRHKYDHKYGFYHDDYEDPDNPKYDEQSQKKFEQLARLHELYSNRLAKANVANSETFQKQQRHKMLSRCESLTLTDMLYGVTGGHNGINDNSSIYSEPAYIPDEEKFCHNCQVSIARPATSQNWYMDPHISASTTELSKNDGARPISGRFQRYCHKTNHKETNLAYLRHPDGASNPNLQESLEHTTNSIQMTQPITKEPNFTLPLPSTTELRILNMETGLTGIKIKAEGYDSGHDSTPRTSKHSPAAISRKAESGYDSVIRDSESSSIDSDTSRASHRNRKCKHKHEKSFCSWFLNPFTCKYIEEPPETHF